MKKIIGVALSLLLLAQPLTLCVMAQQPQQDTAKDLYTKYGNSANNQQGRPGVKVSIRLKRDGRERWASINEKFYSGDYIKLVLDTNFSGYVVVINTGSTNKRALLYPQDDDAISPVNGAVLPPAKDKWIVFDNNPGEERLALIFSAKPIKVGLQHTNLTEAAPPTQQQQGPTSTGGMTNNEDAQNVLAELNTRAITRGKDRTASRDMFTDTIGTETYSVASSVALSEPIGFEFILRHGKR